MVVPNNVNVVSASKANTPSFITSFITNQEKADPSSANPVNAQIKEFIKNLGTNFDVYHHYKVRIRLGKRMLLLWQ